MQSIILGCPCAADVRGNRAGATFQDNRYGQGKRVHTSLTKAVPQKYRCTVCGQERQKPGPVESAKQKKAREEAEAKAEAKAGPKTDKKSRGRLTKGKS